MKNRKLVALICAVLLLVGAAGATLAWLTHQTQTITNTFTAGDITIELNETGAEGTDDQTKEYKMVPGDVESKDPTVTVNAGSEACYLYVKVIKTNDFDKFMDCAIDTAWTKLPGVDGVYYIEVDEATAAAGNTYPVLAGNKVTVKDTITKADLNAVGTNYPTISFKAYAVQSANMTDANDAWTKAAFAN